MEKRKKTRPPENTTTPGRSLNALSSSALICALVFVLALVVYANTIGNEFVWDDRVLIANNPAIGDLDGESLRQLFTTHFWGMEDQAGGLYRPLVSLSYRLDHKIYGMNPLGFHVTNVLLNAITCAFVFIFLQLLFGHRVLALFSAMIFATIPLHSENVAWVAGRTDLIAVFWMLLSLSLYVLARRHRSALLIAASLLAFVGALLSKEIAVVLPVLVLIIETGPFHGRKGGGGNSGGMRRLLLPGVFFAVALAYWIFRESVAHADAGSLPRLSAGVADSVALSLSLVTAYTIKLLSPFNLSAEWEAVTSSIVGLRSLAGLMITLALAVGMYRFRKVGPVLLGTSIIVVGLLPVLHLLPLGELSAERFLYFPSLGFSLLLATLVVWLSGFASPGESRVTSTSARVVLPRALRHRVVAIAFVVLICAYMGRTFARNADWRDEKTLFLKTAAAEPDNARAHHNLGDVYAREGNMEQAVGEYERALQIDPNYAAVLSSYAGILMRVGEIDRAAELLDRAILIDPDNPIFCDNRGILHLQKREYDDAAAKFERARSLSPTYFKAQFNLALTRFLGGDTHQAQQLFEALPHKDTQFVLANYYLAAIHRGSNKTAARRYASQFLSLYPTKDSFRQTATQILSEE